MATDVKAAARAELDDGALTGCRQGIYVNLGTGLAVALVVDGQVVRGSHEAAGEVGYSLRRPGEPPEAARLEEAVSGQALGAAAVRLLGRPNVAALFERAALDPVAGDLVDDFLNELSFHLANLAIALDPERIVVGGGLVRSWDRLEPAISAALLAAPFPPELRLAAHPFDAPLRGALTLGRALITELPTVADVLSEGASA
jgi:glucokinase